MSEPFQLVKLVSGNSGSKRITIPKEVVKQLGLSNAKYVVMTCNGQKKATIAPAKVVIDE